MESQVISQSEREGLVRRRAVLLVRNLSKALHEPESKSRIANSTGYFPSDARRETEASNRFLLGHPN